jgi:hypothetical protein
MAKARRRHHKAENLSAEAFAVIARGLQGSWAYDAIAAEVKRVTGEKITPSSLQRYHAAKFRPQQEAKAEARAIAEALAERYTGMGDAELRRAMELRVFDALMPAIEALKADKPETLTSFFTDLGANRIEEAKLAVKRDELALRNRQLEVMLSREQAKLDEIRRRAEEELKKTTGDGKRSPDATRKAIQDIYGITTSATAAGGSSSPGSAGGVAGTSPASATGEAPRGTAR